MFMKHPSLIFVFLSRKEGEGASDRRIFVSASHKSAKWIADPNITFQNFGSPIRHALELLLRFHLRSFRKHPEKQTTTTSEAAGQLNLSHR